MPLVGWTPARLQRTVILGIKSLWMHRLRSLLTVLGIVFGVCSVIAMLAVGEGASYDVQEQIRQLGSNNIILRSVKPREEERPSSGSSYVIEYGLTYDDVTRIRESIPGVTVIMPGRLIREQVWNGPKHKDLTMLGTVPWFPEMRNVRIVEGRFFSQQEMDGKKNVCVLTQEASDALFPFAGAVGDNIRIGSDYYKVVGITDTLGQSAPATSGSSGESDGGQPQMFIPLTAAKDRFGEVLAKRSSGSREFSRIELHEAVVKVENQNEVEEISLIVDDLLKRHHKKGDYEIVVPLRLLRSAERTKQIFNIVLGAIAAISLVVGGIGIMNIMLASVTERTREIGIRRALGAKKRDIIVQFLIETVILSGAGGIIGVALGIAIPFMITAFADMKTIVTPWAPLVAFSISALVGVIFGIYPALRAANMNPVEALRHE